MTIRTPAVAGHFYPDSKIDCRDEIETCLSAIPAPDPDSPASEWQAAFARGAEEPVGGIVPHAGWICSGAVAAEVLRCLAGRPNLETFVLFGAAHRLAADRGAVFSQGAWSTPLGEVAVDEDLASAVLSGSSALHEDDEPHLIEHSIEVQLPFIQHLAPAARILPILVPHNAAGPSIGRVVAEQARLIGRQAVFVGSTDLTHYGPRYGFVPQGVGPEGLRWAKEVNDRQVLEMICRMRADEVGPLARRTQAACGAGAIAATIAACRHSGATRGVLLRHTTSDEVLRGRFGPSTDAVGYAGLIFPRPTRRMSETSA